MNRKELQQWLDSQLAGPPSITMCPACTEPFYDGQRLVRASAGQVTALVHENCQRRYRAKCYGRDHVCPQCNGLGQQENKNDPITEQQRDLEAEGYNGWFSHPVYRRVVTGYRRIPCTLCDSWGYLEVEPVPIVKTTVVGYRIP